MLLSFEDGGLFKKVESEKEEEFESYMPDYDNIPFDYKRVTEFEIKPSDELIELSHNPEINIKYGKFSIDGEAYPLDHYKAKVLNKVFSVFSLP